MDGLRSAILVPAGFQQGHRVTAICHSRGGDNQQLMFYRVIYDLEQFLHPEARIQATKIRTVSG